MFCFVLVGIRVQNRTLQNRMVIMWIATPSAMTDFYEGS